MSRINRNRTISTAALTPSIPSIKPVPNSSSFRSSGYLINSSEKDVYMQLPPGYIDVVKSDIERDRIDHGDINSYSNSIIEKINRNPPTPHRVYVAYTDTIDSEIARTFFIARGSASFRGNVIKLIFHSENDGFIDDNYKIKFNIEKYKAKYGEYPNFIFFEEEASKLKKKPSPKKRKTFKQGVSDFLRKNRTTQKFHRIVPV